jgi:hypothetical protein
MGNKSYLPGAQPSGPCEVPTVESCILDSEKDARWEARGRSLQVSEKGRGCFLEAADGSFSQNVEIINLVFCVE